MRVITSVRIKVPAERVWPLLTGATLPLPRPFCFRMGIPTPVECRLPSGIGGVGAERECVTDRGRIRQRITVWDPPRVLAFERVEDTLGLERLLSTLKDTFTVEPIDGGVRLTRASEGAFAAGGTASAMGRRPFGPRNPPARPREFQGARRSAGLKEQRGGRSPSRPALIPSSPSGGRVFT